MLFLRPWLSILTLVLAASCGQAANTTVRLLLSHEAARPGDTLLAGVQLRMAPKWHTYWRNGGDSGAPTQIEWSLPAGVSAGEIQWPVPERYEAEGLITYVYHGEALLLVPLTVASGAATGAHEIKAKVSWLECEKLCVADHGEVTAQLVIGPESRPSKDARSIEAAQKKLPGTKPAADARAAWSGPARDDTRVLLLEWTADPATQAADFFPYANDNFQVKTTNEQHSVTGGKVKLRRGVVNLAKGWPSEIGGLLIETGADGLSKAYETTLQIGQAGLSPASRSGTSTPGSAVSFAAPQKKSLLGVLGGAFLGGLILNLMPCVLPVLALKVLSFVRQSQEAPARVRWLGLTYGGGVLVSFLILALITIALKASWGSQFQSPQFLVGITVLLTLMALNLFGVFEVTAGSRTMDAAGGLAAKEGAAGAFFNGVVAVILGTSCTAPVLGGALGYAVTQTVPVIVATFLAVGVGLAFPYVFLSFFPALSRFLPKPGAWMERFKILLGFPVLGTAVWILSQLPTHFGNAGVLWVGLFLVVVGIAAWIFGQFVQRGTTRRGWAGASAVVLVIVGYAVALEHELHWRTPADPESPGRIAKHDPDGIDWRPWSAESVAAARAAGRPVFVEFTADWCLNCQLNKRSSIEITRVRQRLKEIDAVPLLGDFTRKSQLIDEELKRHGRNGVPLVLVYPKDAAKPPLVLPELLTPSIVLDALDQAVK